MYSDITGVILAGGKSTRMGVNKSFLQVGDKKIIERISDLMKLIFEKVILITNTPDDYKFLNLPLFEDVYKWKGPLAGIHSALVHSGTEKIFVLSCDVPFMSKEMIEYIVDYKTDYPVTICKVNEHIQQLVGKYSKSVLSVIEKILSDDLSVENVSLRKKRSVSVLQLLEKVGADIINAESLDFYSEQLFVNINTPQDYEFVIDILKKQSYFE